MSRRSAIGMAALFLVMGLLGIVGAKQEKLNLPSWAPKHPSKEFLRAAKVLKPLPQEVLQSATRSEPGLKAAVKRIGLVWTAAYEWFGSLSDTQIRRFQQHGEIRMPVRSLTAKQRAALDRYIARSGEARKLIEPGGDDRLVTLYKMGAKQDLSNVDVGFVTYEISKGSKGHVVDTAFWVRSPRASTSPLTNVFATR